MAAPRLQMAEELLRCFSATMRSVQLYSKGHPIIVKNIAAFSTAIQLLHAIEPSIVIGMIGDEIIVGDMPIRAMRSASIAGCPLMISVSPSSARGALRRQRAPGP